MTATRKRGLSLIVAAGPVLLALAWSFFCPWLVALPRASATALYPIELAGAVVVALFAWRATRAAMALGPRGAIILGGVVALFGTSASVAAGLTVLTPIGIAEAAATALAGVGVTLLIALLVTLLAWWRLGHLHKLDSSEPSGRAVPLRALAAGAAGALAAAAWALATAHVLGQLHFDSEQNAVDEARDLAAIVAERALISEELDAFDATLLPPGGFIVALDDKEQVVAGVGVAPGTRVNTERRAVDRCRVGHRTLPCAVRRLVDGTIIAAAVPPRPIARAVVLGFLFAGLIVAAVALALGALIGGGVGADLRRVTETLDALGTTTRALDQPIVAVSNDEVGALATALGRLRARLSPGLAEYQAALEKAEAADRTRSDFLTLISAELRTPLDRILTAARTLLDPASAPLSDEQKEDVRIVLTSVTHLIELIDEVLDLSAIASGQVMLRMNPVDVGRLVGDVARAQRPLVQKGVEIKLSIGTPSPTAHADERRLRQVVTNIISNAVKFTERGSIELSVQTEGGHIVVRVQDSGPGIAEEQLPKLFSEFVQLGSLTHRARGTGLGLAICKRLVEAHGGQVTAESQLGVGSTFCVILPAGSAS
jgi:signal transduction histidine kinase